MLENFEAPVTFQNRPLNCLYLTRVCDQSKNWFGYNLGFLSQMKIGKSFKHHVAWAWPWLKLYSGIKSDGLEALPFFEKFHFIHVCYNDKSSATGLLCYLFVIRDGKWEWWWTFAFLNLLSILVTLQKMWTNVCPILINYHWLQLEFIKTKS